MLSEQLEVDVEERGEDMPMVGLHGHSSTSTANGQSSNAHQSTPWRTQGNEEEEDEDEIEVDENSELNRHAGTTSDGLRSHNNRDLDLDDLEHQSEKSFKYYKELPDHTKLYDAKKKSPGFRAIGAGLLLLTGLGYLIAYLCTSVSISLGRLSRYALKLIPFLHLTPDNTIFSCYKGIILWPT